MKVILKRNELQAAALFASSDESRFVLNGIFVELRKGKQPLMVATDGRRLVVIETESVQDDNKQEGSFILRKDFLARVFTLAKSFKCDELKLEIIPQPGNKNPKVVVTLFSQSLASTMVLDGGTDSLIEGNYPNWRNVVPEPDAKPSQGVMCVLSQFIVDYERAFRLLKPGNCTSIIMRPTIDNLGPIEVFLTGVPNFYGVLMPYSIIDPIQQPAFVKKS